MTGPTCFSLNPTDITGLFLVVIVVSVAAYWGIKAINHYFSR